MSEPRVVTVVLTGNRRDDVLACLESLEASTYGNHGILVLDNASSDGSVAAIRSAFPDVEVTDLTDNLGYAENNVGLRAEMAQQADYVFVLNDDTVLEPGCLSRLVEVGERDRQVGVLGPMVYHDDEPDVIQSAGGRLDRSWRSLHIAQNEPDRGQFVEPRAVDWISGCAILVRRTVLDEIGLLDERFFIYWEEVDWCVRAGKGGWRVVHVPRAKLWHKGVQRDYRPQPGVTYYSTRNRFLLLSKHGAPPAVWIVVWGQTLRTLASWSVRPKWRSMRAHRDAMWRGALDFLRRRWGPMPS